MDRIRVPIQQLAHAAGLPLPEQMTDGASGIDLPAAVKESQVLQPMERQLIPTGIRIALPAGFEAEVRPRSGLAVKLGLTVINAPGTIDADYRGEIKVPLINLGSEAVTVRRGDRIAQMVVQPVTRVKWWKDGPMDDTERGASGFGHTGT